MKKLNYSSTFKASFTKVKTNFSNDLFKFLLPKFIPAKILRYDGQKIDDEIHIQIVNQLWVSKITEVNDLDKEYNFTDEGVTLPFPLKKWHHRHRIVKVNETEVSIIDEISFDCGNAILNTIMYPILFAQFIPRIKLYKKYFKNKLYDNK